jgi:type IV secretion system protein VirB10
MRESAMTANPIGEAPVVGDAPLARPEVAQRARASRGLLGYGAVGLAGIATLIALSAQRTSRGQDGLVGTASAATVPFTAPQPLPAEANPAAGLGPVVVGGAAVPAPQFATDNSVPVAPDPMPAVAASAPIAMPIAAGGGGGVTRLTAPAVVVDLGAGPAPLGAARAGALANPALAADAKADDGTAGFIQRAAARQDAAHAASIGKLGSIVSEGTIISATMETAINSDLPGFARAVIARDVMSFDGTRMLIPRGSRVLGQYKSGVAMGASRVFIIWTRLIRPDGVAVDLTSPGGDDLGRGGLGGKVDRHFLQRFGGSILMSVLNGAISLGTASLGNGTPVYINSVAEAGQAATSAMRSGDIPPTIRTPQGASVKIFVARDLDFSDVEQSR